ncbi:hypothetical protein ER308_13715 [Egibacter rhizosphaerae]|uniref:Asp/Glu racemase n=1 Tax=Egibacter rhizosphaerae TaxID=1670831 RepID=A0A411YH27_9ACTN|nr:aspartate/glutamate racemase family protein [Egibacter rhizosphaerae]QBI20517.1 hypothetical protein ER308_13715 [Egibacter rhizosphaerae]
MGRTIGVIHATTLSLEPMSAALERALPDAGVRNVLDDSLLTDLQAAGELTDALRARIERLIEHLLHDGVDAVQLACSGFAPVVDAARDRHAVPIHKPDDAMYREVVAAGYGHVGILGTVPAALELAAGQVAAFGREAGREVTVTTVCRPEGMAAAQAGDDERLEQAMTDAAREAIAEGADGLALAQYSLARAAGPVTGAAEGRPVHTGPDAAAARLERALR